MIQDLIIIIILGIIVVLFYTIIDKNTNLQSGCPNWQGDGLQNRFVWVRVPLLTQKWAKGQPLKAITLNHILNGVWRWQNLEMYEFVWQRKMSIYKIG